MTKISSISEAAPLSPQRRMNKAEKGAFEKSLAGAMETGEANGAKKPPAAAPLGEVQPLKLTIENSSVEVVHKTDKLLDMLDHYSRDIGDPKKTLKDIEPLINEIKENATRLMEGSQGAMDQDDRLKEIATRCALTANVEYVKFQRGDYN